MNYYNIENKIINIHKILAHTHNIKKHESLLDHMKLTMKYFNDVCYYKHLDCIVDNCINNIFYDNKVIDTNMFDFIKTMFINAIWLHDVGKINPKFQKNQMKNNSLDYKRLIGNDKHSLLSSLIYIQIYTNSIEEQFKNNNHIMILKNILYKFAYVISKHHSNLNNTNDFVDNLQTLQDELESVKNNKQGYLEYYLDREKVLNLKIENTFLNNRISSLFLDDFSLYILTKLLYSFLTSCDFYATTKYMNDLEPKYKTIDNIDKLIEIYKNQEVTQIINQYENNKSILSNDNINKYRCDAWIESNDILLKNLDKNLFFLPAPTGCGKTNMSINLCLQILKNVKNINKMFYISPFNVVGTQTHNILKDIFQNKLNPQIINSTSSIENAESEKNYIEIYNNRQHLHYGCVTTSHIRFFNWLTGTTRDSLFPLLQLCNSVVVLDEIQSYRNDIWTEISMLLFKYADLLNIKIINMSATLPKISELLKIPTQFNVNSQCVDLIQNKKHYYDNDVFKKRVNLDFSMLSTEINSLENLADIIIDKMDSIKVKDKKRNVLLGKKILIEFIKKKTAGKFYNILKNKLTNINIERITNDEKGGTKQKIINEFNDKNTQDMILVTTQCIEAGVDLDAHIGFKDISLIDSEEQFIGRVNRSFLKEGSRVFFFNYDNTNHYKNDLRREINILNEEFKEYLINKDFDLYYKKVFEKITEYKNKLTSKNNINQFIQYVKDLNFKKIDEYITLINSENTYQIFLNYNTNNISGKDIWDNIKNLRSNNLNLNYCEQQVKLINAYSLMNNFTYTCYYYKGNSTPCVYDDNIGNIYYIENGYKYIMEDGKLDRELLEREIVGSINDYLLIGD